MSIEGLEDESNDLQYRTYFGQAEGTKRLGRKTEPTKTYGMIGMWDERRRLAGFDPF